MNRLIVCFLFLVLCLGQISAQGPVLRYEYWFDANVAGAQQIQVPPQWNPDFTLQPDVSMLTEGLHTLYFRSQDSTGLWSPVFSAKFLKQPFVASAGSGLSQIEYWFNQAYTAKTTYGIQPANQLDRPDTITMESLSSGMHTLRFRVRNEQGIYSSVFSANVIRQESAPSGSHELASLECWFDRNHLSKQIIPVNASMNFDSILAYPVMPISEGLHSLHLRAITKGEKRSSVQTVHFIKLPHSSSASGDLATFEYWTDSGYNSRSILPLPTGKLNLLIDTIINPQAFSRGMHTLYVRLIDDRGMPSPVAAHSFIKHDLSNGGSANEITSISLRLQGDTVGLALIPAFQPGKNIELITQANLAQKPTASYLVQCNIMDASGLYAQVLVDTFFKSAIPDAQINASQILFCDSGTVSFSSQIFDADSIRWDFGNGQFSNAPSAVIHYAAAGVYQVSLVAVDRLSMRADTAMIQITVDATPQVNLGADRYLCPGDSVMINAGNPGSSYLWSNGSLSNAVYLSLAGQYSVTVSSPHGCQTADSLILLYYPLPIVNLGNDTAFCQGDSLSLNAFNSGASYQWSVGDTTPVINVWQTGIYTVVVSSSNQCVATDSISITVHPLPLVNLGPDLVFCDGDSAELNAGSGMSSYHWNTGASAQIITVYNSGKYWVNLSDGNGCQSSDTVQVTVKALPHVDLGPDTLLSTVGSILLDASYPGATYLWNTGAVTPTLLVNMAGKYWVRLELGGCEASDTVRIDIDYGVDVPGLSLIRVYPNPAGDYLILEWPAELSPSAWQLYDATGRIVASKGIFNQSETATRLDIGYLAPGMYLLEVLSDGRSFGTRVLISR
jgi:PKD repeat protein